MAADVFHPCLHGIGSRLLEVLYIKSKKKTQVPNCPGAELSCLLDSWCRNVSHRCRIVRVPKCLAFLHLHLLYGLQCRYCCANVNLSVRTSVFTSASKMRIKTEFSKTFIFTTSWFFFTLNVTVSDQVDGYVCLMTVNVMTVSSEQNLFLVTEVHMF